MAAHPLPLDDLVAWCLGASAPRVGERAVVVVDLDDDAGWDTPPIPEDLPRVVVGTTVAPDPVAHAAAPACDVVVPPDGDDLAALLATVERNPHAAFALARVLRRAAADDLVGGLEVGLEVESRAYSDLQGGPEFRRWLAAHERRDRGPEGDPVRMERTGDRLLLTLARPQVRNALSAAMREALLDGLAIAAADPEVQVELRGDGPTFCSGGDLVEFGTFTSPDDAHRLRLERSIGRAIARVADRVVVHVHGDCAGSGVELPAFAGHVVATPDATFRLPEVALGLIPGAGGTVSLPARIGRHRTALLGLTGTPVDAATALAWGLVDELSGGTT